MNDRKKVYYFKKKEIPYFIAYFLMAFSNVVIANSYLFGENRYDICVFTVYIVHIVYSSTMHRKIQIKRFNSAWINWYHRHFYYN